MATSKEYKDFVLECLADTGEISCRAMMGEYLLYYNKKLIGGIYDNRVLVKITSGNEKYNMPKEIPYEGAKPQYMIEDIEDRDKVKNIIIDTYNSIK